MRLAVRERTRTTVVAVAAGAVLAVTLPALSLPTATADAVPVPIAPATTAAAEPAAGSRVVPGIVAVRTADHPDTWTAVRAPGTAAGLRLAARRPGVIDATLVYRRSASTFPVYPDDPELRRGRQRWIDAAALRSAWQVRGRVRTVVVAVIDTGVDLANPELRGRFVRDRAGRIVGHDFVSRGAPQDLEGHGTAVAGVIAAAGGNGIGIVGGAPNARIMPVRVLDAEGNGNDLTVARGIRWAVDHGAEVLNLSLGGPDASRVLASAIAYAVRRGRIVVAAAGNDPSARLRGESVYPAALPGVVGVGATDDAGRLASFSSTGPWVDVVAPGVNVRSVGLGGGTVVESGTSLAAPVVAAAVALTRGYGHSLAFVRAGLCRSSRDIGAPGRDPMTGCGLIHAGALVRGVPVPALPRSADHRDDQPIGARPLGPPALVDRLGDAGDTDWYRIDPVGGSRTRYTVSARALGVRYPNTQDSAIALLLVNSTGGIVGSAVADLPDDTVTVTAVADGPVWARVSNTMSSGGLTYRIGRRIAPVGASTPVRTASGRWAVRGTAPGPDVLGASRTAPITVSLLGSSPVAVSLVRVDGPDDVTLRSTSTAVAGTVSVLPTGALPARAAIEVRVAYTDRGRRYLLSAGAFRTRG